MDLLDFVAAAAFVSVVVFWFLLLNDPVGKNCDVDKNPRADQASGRLPGDKREETITGSPDRGSTDQRHCSDDPVKKEYVDCSTELQTKAKNIHDTDVNRLQGSIDGRQNNEVDGPVEYGTEFTGGCTASNSPINDGFVVEEKGSSTDSSSQFSNDKVVEGQDKFFDAGESAKVTKDVDKIIQKVVLNPVNSCFLENRTFKDIMLEQGCAKKDAETDNEVQKNCVVLQASACGTVKASDTDLCLEISNLCLDTCLQQPSPQLPDLNHCEPQFVDVTHNARVIAVDCATDVTNDDAHYSSSVAEDTRQSTLLLLVDDTVNAETIHPTSTSHLLPDSNDYDQLHLINDANNPAQFVNNSPYLQVATSCIDTHITVLDVPPNTSVPRSCPSIITTSELVLCDTDGTGTTIPLTNASHQNIGSIGISNDKLQIDELFETSPVNNVGRASPPNVDLEGIRTLASPLSELPRYLLDTDAATIDTLLSTDISSNASISVPTLGPAEIQQLTDSGVYLSTVHLVSSTKPLSSLSFAPSVDSTVEIQPLVDIAFPCAELLNEIQQSADISAPIIVFNIKKPQHLLDTCEAVFQSSIEVQQLTDSTNDFPLTTTARDLSSDIQLTDIQAFTIDSPNKTQYQLLTTTFTSTATVDLPVEIQVLPCGVCEPTVDLPIGVQECTKSCSEIEVPKVDIETTLLKLNDCKPIDVQDLPIDVQEYTNICPPVIDTPREKQEQCEISVPSATTNLYIDVQDLPNEVQECTNICPPVIDTPSGKQEQCEISVPSATTNLYIDVQDLPNEVQECTNICPPVIDTPSEKQEQCEISVPSATTNSYIDVQDLPNEVQECTNICPPVIDTPSGKQEQCEISVPSATTNLYINVQDLPNEVQECTNICPPVIDTPSEKQEQCEISVPSATTNSYIDVQDLPNEVQECTNICPPVIDTPSEKQEQCEISVPSATTNLYIDVQDLPNEVQECTNICPPVIDTPSEKQEQCEISVASATTNSYIDVQDLPNDVQECTNICPPVIDTPTEKQEQCEISVPSATTNSYIEIQHLANPTTFPVDSLIGIQQPSEIEVPKVDIETTLLKLNDYKHNPLVKNPAQVSQSINLCLSQSVDDASLNIQHAKHLDDHPFPSIGHVEAEQSIDITKNSSPIKSPWDITLKMSSENSPITKTSPDVCILHLNIDDDFTCGIYRLSKQQTLRFAVTWSATVQLFVDYPSEGMKLEPEYTFREIKLTRDKEQGSAYADIFLTVAGSFRFYCVIGKEYEKRKCSGFFLVDPNINLSETGHLLSLNGIMCQTVVSKCLGSFDDWMPRIRVTAESGFNTVHFTPMQELGPYGSSYAIKNQMKISPLFGTTVEMSDIESLVTNLQRSHTGLVSVCDVVLNHTACESEWIRAHPECTYNLFNCPYLRPAYILDRIIHQFLLEVGNGQWEKSDAIPAVLIGEESLRNIGNTLHTKVLPQHCIQEFYLASTEKCIFSFRELMTSYGKKPIEVSVTDELTLTHDPEYRRLNASVDLHLAAKLFYDDQLDKACELLAAAIGALNEREEGKISYHLDSAVDNLVSELRRRMNEHKGHLDIRRIVSRDVSWLRFFVCNSLDDRVKDYTISDHEAMMYREKEAELCMAHSGWLDHDVPLRDFTAEPSGSVIYLRRDLHTWTDSVKLRYGRSPADCPALWAYMSAYVTESARGFQGMRIDNCHTTPLHVGEWMMKEARRIRPDLYVIAELVTDDIHAQTVYTNHLGLNAIILNTFNCSSAGDLCSALLKVGAEPVGTFLPHSVIHPLVPRSPPVILVDQTHDDPSPLSRNSPLNCLPVAAVLAMSVSAVGSNRGYDELVPYHVSIIKEYRLFRAWLKDGPNGEGDASEHKACHGTVDSTTGMIAARKTIARLHEFMADEGFSQIYVDQRSDAVVAVTRHDPLTHRSIVLVAYTAYGHHHLENATEKCPPIRLHGVLTEIVLEIMMHAGEAMEFHPDSEYITGIGDYMASAPREHIRVEESEMIRVKHCPGSGGGSEESEVVFENFSPGSVIAFMVSLSDSCQNALCHIRETVSELSNLFDPAHTSQCHNQPASSEGLLRPRTREMLSSLKNMQPDDAHYILFGHDGDSFGIYNVPGYGTLAYPGLRGLVMALRDVQTKNDLGHPICKNLREGDWLIDYTTTRLITRDQPIKSLGEFLAVEFNQLKRLPRFLIPCYFDSYIYWIHAAVVQISLTKISALGSPLST